MDSKWNRLVLLLNKIQTWNCTICTGSVTRCEGFFERERKRHGVLPHEAMAGFSP